MAARPLIRIIAVLAGAVALCWTALVNGQPFLHPDSLAYIRGPEVAMVKLLGPRFASPWVQLDPGGAVDRMVGRASPAPSVAGGAAKSVQAGRSVYYGILADLGARMGGLWLTIFVQALAVALLVDILLRALDQRDLTAYVGVMAILALASPAAFFACLIMPDIWAGLSIAALAMLLTLACRLTRWDIAALAAMIVFAGLAHTSIPPVIALMMLVGAVGWLFDRHQRPALGLAVGALALVVAVAGGLAFTALVKHTTGAAPVGPPFLTARLVEDGTGARFIKAGCPGHSFQVCRYADRLPLDADHFLWGQTAKDGLYQTVSPAERRALSQEQVGFAIAVARAYPLDQAKASLRNAIGQIIYTDLSDFNYKPLLHTNFGVTLPTQTLEVMRRTRAWAQAWPIDRLWGLQSLLIGAVAFLIGLAAVVTRRTPADEASQASNRLLALVLLGVLANGALCGALSSINGRYEARVIWCMPLVALAWLLTRLRTEGAIARPGSISSDGPA